MKRVPYEKRATRKKYNMAKEQDEQIQQFKTFSIRKSSSGVLLARVSQLFERNPETTKKAAKETSRW